MNPCFAVPVCLAFAFPIKLLLSWVTSFLTCFPLIHSPILLLGRNEQAVLELSCQLGLHHDITFQVPHFTFFFLMKKVLSSLKKNTRIKGEDITIYVFPRTHTVWHCEHSKNPHFEIFRRETFQKETGSCNGNLKPEASHFPILCLPSMQLIWFTVWLSTFSPKQKSSVVQKIKIKKEVKYEREISHKRAEFLWELSKHFSRRFLLRTAGLSNSTFLSLIQIRPLFSVCYIFPLKTEAREGF